MFEARALRFAILRPLPMPGQPQMQSLVHEPRVDNDRTSVLDRVGLIATGGALAAIIASLPVSFRTGEGGSFGLVLERWLVLSGITTPLAVFAVAVLQRARVGLRMVVGENKTPLALGVLWWSVIQLGLLSVVGAVLRKTTHHHALAGVTFALFAVVSGLVVLLFAGRTTSLLLPGGERIRKMGLRVGLGCVCLAVLIVGLRTSRAEGLHTTAAIADAFALVVTTLIASSRWFGRFKRVSKMGLPVAGLLVVIGLVTLRLDAPLRKDLDETAPTFMLLGSAFGTDGESKN